MVCTGVLGSEVGFGLWLGTSSFLVTCAWTRSRVSWFVPFARLRGSFFGMAPHCRLDSLMPSSVWDRWCLAVSCRIFRIGLMSGANYRNTVKLSESESEWDDGSDVSRALCCCAL
jgi:hypothetical protein